MRNGFKKWNRKVTGSVSGKWTKELLDSVEVLRLIPLERMAMNYHIDADHILRSFTWFTTPQGPSKWTKEQLDGVVIFKIYLLEKMAWGFDVEWHDILYSFDWKSTPQGYGYWSDLHDRYCDEGPQPLPREELDFCKALFARYC
jgi:hypothetical protein